MASPSAFWMLLSIRTISENSPRCISVKAMDAPTAPHPITATFLGLSMVHVPPSPVMELVCTVPSIL